MFDGMSPDGRGNSQYVGRTENLNEATDFYDENKKSPYWTGYVLVVTDTKIYKM